MSVQSSGRVPEAIRKANIESGGRMSQILINHPPESKQQPIPVKKSWWITSGVSAWLCGVLPPNIILKTIFIESADKGVFHFRADTRFVSSTWYYRRYGEIRQSRGKKYCRGLAIKSLREYIQNVRESDVWGIALTSIRHPVNK